MRIGPVSIWYNREENAVFIKIELSEHHRPHLSLQLVSLTGEYQMPVTLPQKLPFTIPTNTNTAAVIQPLNMGLPITGPLDFTYSSDNPNCVVSVATDGSGDCDCVLMPDVDFTANITATSPTLGSVTAALTVAGNILTLQLTSLTPNA